MPATLEKEVFSITIHITHRLIALKYLQEYSEHRQAVGMCDGFEKRIILVAIPMDEVQLKHLIHGTRLARLSIVYESVKTIRAKQFDCPI